MSLTYGGNTDGDASEIYSETMGDIFSYASGCQLISSAALYGMGTEVASNMKNNMLAGAANLQAAYNNYVAMGAPFSSWNPNNGGPDPTLGTISTLAWKFIEHAEQQGQGYQTPAQRMMKLLQLFNGSMLASYAPQSNTQAAATFRSTLMVAALSYAFSEDLRGEFRSLNFPINDATYEQLYAMATGGPAFRFIPITPCRIADTRNTPDGPFSGPSIAGGTSRDFVIPNSACGIPSTAAAYSLNVAVVPQGPLGYLTVWPTGQSQPLVATLNSDGRIKSNAAIIPAGANGAISAFATNTTDLVLDINGYFVPAADTGALQFYPLTPCRVADTRNANGPLGGPFIPGGQSRTFPILSSSCGVPSSAQAYSLNLAAVPRGTLGYLTAWPTGQPQPFVATLNAPTGTITANAALVAAGTGGQIDVFATNDTDLVIDMNGYFAAPGTGGLSLYNLSPCRVLDTRDPSGTPPFDGQRDVNVTASRCGTPSAAQAYVFNATVVPAGQLGYLALWPQGETQPVMATLNAPDGAITGNMAIVPTNNGSISAWATNPTHLVLDIFGYFAP